MIYWYCSETPCGIAAVAAVRFPDGVSASYRLGITLDCKVDGFIPHLYYREFPSLNDALKELANGFVEMDFYPVQGVEQDAPLLDSFKVVS